MQQLTHTPTENPSTNVDGNQQNMYDINIQRQELEKFVQVFLHSYNATAIEDVDSGAIAEFGGLQKKVR